MEVANYRAILFPIKYMTCTTRASVYKFVKEKKYIVGREKEKLNVIFCYAAGLLYI
jgi:hypothetical protein